MGMNLQTFRAPTMAECLSEVKRVMGTEAVILHTRTYVLRRWLGFRGREMVEITAGRGLNNGARSRRAQPVMTKYVDAQAMPSAPMKAVLPAPVEPAANGKAILETAAGNSAMIVGLSADVTKLTAMVTDLMKNVNKQ